VHRALPLLVALAALAITAPAASGATVQRTECARAGCVVQPLQVEGAPGEVNALTLAVESRTIVVRDTGAPPVAGDGCVQRDAQSVACAIAPTSVETLELDVFARDGNDTVDASALTGLVTLLIMYGGDGDDVLTAGSGAGTPTAEGQRDLYGGRGRDALSGSPLEDGLIGGDDEDTLRGGDGRDFLWGDGVSVDDDTPASDVLDGGEGRDMADFSGHEDPVLVDLVKGEGGVEGERDLLTSIEQVTGSRGRSTLLGDDGANVLLEASKGSRCGRGPDAIRPKNMRAFPYVPSDCERVGIGTVAEVSRPVVLSGKRGIRMRLFPFGRRLRGRIEFRVDGKVVARALLRTATGDQRLRRIVARLTSRGRATRFAGRRLETRIKRGGMDTVGFRIKLKG
jgi:Ca2+-binding RTX toxin-like protein